MSFYTAFDRLFEWDESATDFKLYPRARAADQETVMTWGIPTTLFLQFHVAISLIGIASGFVVIYGLLTDKLLKGWTALFLGTTILTSVTGFPLPPFGFDPPRAIGTLSLVLLAIAVAALYLFNLAGPWRWAFIITATMAFYFNAFVAVIQAFQKLSFLQPLAPTQSELPFVIAQLAVLIMFIAFGVLAVKRFHPKFGATT
jgi:hypothetical protein